MKTQFKSTFEYKLIYVFRINDELHNGLVKIGDATLHTNESYDKFQPNCKELNQAAKARINSYTSTAGIVYELLHTEIAIKTEDGKVKAFRDKKVHDVLIRSGVQRHLFKTESQGKEWFETDPIFTLLLASTRRRSKVFRKKQISFFKCLLIDK